MKFDISYEDFWGYYKSALLEDIEKANLIIDKLSDEEDKDILKTLLNSLSKEIITTVEGILDFAKEDSLPKPKSEYGKRMRANLAITEYKQKMMPDLAEGDKNFD